MAKRILMVDDEPYVVESCAQMLELKGFEVQGVTSGIEAIALYQQQRFDLVLLDVQMPGMNGLEVLRALKEYDPAANVAILTAYGTKEIVIEALRLGAREFMEKPIDLRALAAAASRLLENNHTNVLRGSLRTLSLPTIVQVNSVERTQARLQIKRRGKVGYVFFAGGEVMHAEVDSLVGPEALYELLTWEDGSFVLEMDVLPPTRTIAEGWSGLLMEGLRRIDERSIANEIADGIANEIADELAIGGENGDGDDDYGDYGDDRHWGQRPVYSFSPYVSEQIEYLLEELLSKARGRCVLMTGRGGRLIHWYGDISQGQAISLAALVSGSFSATAEIADVLRNEGEVRRFEQSLQESEDFSIWSVSADEALIVSIVFEKEVPLGLVRVYTLQTVHKIKELLLHGGGEEQYTHQEEEAAFADLLSGLDGLDEEFGHDVEAALDDLFGE